MYYQTKLQVVNPETGNEEFVVVHNLKPGERALQMVRVSDVARYGVMGFSYDILNKRKRAGKIMFRDQHGSPARPGPGASYVCLRELSGEVEPPAMVHISTRKKRSVHA